MKKILIIIMAITLAISISAKEYTADEIIDISTEKTKVDGMESVMRLVIHDKKGNMKERKLASVSKLYDNGETTKSLMRFLTPADVKGTGFLTYSYDSEQDNDQWLYLPSLRKIRKIVSSEKGNSFMGSEFTYADISGVKKADFDFEIIGEKEINGENCWMIEEKPVSEEKEDEYDLLRKVVYIAKSDFVVRRAEVYNFDDEIYKVMTVKDVKKIDPEKDKYKIMYMKVENVENGRISEMINDNIKLNREVKDEYFTFRYLKR